MTEDQITLALSLVTVRMKPFTSKYQFTRRMEYQALNEPEKPITDAEFRYLCLLVSRYHKELSAELVRLARDYLEVLKSQSAV